MIKKFTLFLVATTACVYAKAQSPGAIIDVKHYSFNLKLNDKDNQIKGRAEISLKFLKNAESFKISLVKKNESDKGMLVSTVTEKGVPIKFSQDKDDININTTAKAGTEHKYTITYQGVPADGLIISTNKFGHRTFFGDNWPNRAHNWLPCVDEPADKAQVDFVVTAPDHYQVVANGSKVIEKELPGKMKLTHWKESAPIPTKVMVIGVAEFAIDHPGDVNKIPVYTYVFPDNKEVGFSGYSVAKEILAYYMDRVGPYAYEKLANVQSKTIFGGMENASCIFYYENSVGDREIEALMAHEIGHQWFGDAASEKNFAHLWLSEGFATYMTNLYLEQKYGEDILKSRLEKDREKVLAFEKERMTPVVDTSVKSNYMVMLNANSYEKGGWVLHMLRRKLGDEAFWKGIRAYYAKYENSNANTDDLRAEMEKASGQDLQPFFKQWLFTTGHPQLGVTWSYDADKKSVNIDIEQKQDMPYVFTLECMIGGQLKKFDISNKTTAVSVEADSKPASITVDPNVNLLASFEVAEKK